VTMDNRSAPIRPGFSDFLAEPVGREKNGMQLSLLSALTRLGFDPWEEAASLARMPRAAAAKALTAMLDRLPAGDWEPADCASIASKLVHKLPPADNSASVDVGQDSENTWSRLRWPIAVCGMLLAAVWFMFVRN